MKKNLLIGLILFTSACQATNAAPTPVPVLPQTATVPASPKPIPASPTPEPTSTLEPTLTPTPLPRYFTTQFDSSLAGWSVLQAGNETLPNISTENGNLRLQMDNPYVWLYTLYGAQDYADVYIETEFINSALSPASAGLICRYSETDGWLEYNVSTDGTYNILFGRWLSVGVADYLPITDGASKEIKRSGEMQQIGLTCSGTVLQLYINGNIIRNVNVSSYELPAGKAGLAVSSFENVPVVVVFNYVTINEP
jgi:hypothetical protein